MYRLWGAGRRPYGGPALWARLPETAGAPLAGAAHHVLLRPWGYRGFLEAIADPDHKQHDEMLEWIGGHFDPTDVSAEASRRP